MKKYAAIGLAALLCSAAPAFAAWDQADFSMRDTHDSVMGRLMGDTVQLSSRDGDVYCRDVEARFDNGRARTVFRGAIPAGETVNVQIPGGPDMHQLDFDCRPTTGFRARVDVASNDFGPGWRGDRYGYNGDRYGYNYEQRRDPVSNFFGHVLGR